MYCLLVDDALPPPNEHWEGFVARRIVQALGVDAMRDENERLEADVKEMREALIDATVHLIGAASAYEKYAKRFGGIKPQAVIDPFFGTRHMDFHKAADRAQAYLNKAATKQGAKHE